MTITAPIRRCFNVRPEGLVLLILGALVFPAFGSQITFPSIPATAGTVVDGCSNCLFSDVPVSAGAVGDALTSWSFYALQDNPVVPVIFNSSGAVVGYGAAVTPAGTGLQTALFGLQAGTNILAAGDTVGFYYPDSGSIAFSYGGPAVSYKPLGSGETMGLGTTTTQNAGARTYDVSFTASSDQTALGPPSTAPDPSAITDGATSTYYAYDLVTSQYNGQLLTSWSFYELNTNVVIPVIYSAGPDSHVIGYGQAVTPANTTGLQTFAYVPVVGTNVLATGEYLGWYTPGQGAIAFDLTGGLGVLDNPNVADLQTGVYPYVAIPNRNYYVGFSITAPTPEPGTSVALATGLGLLMLARRKFRNR